MAGLLWLQVESNHAIEKWPTRVITTPKRLARGLATSLELKRPCMVTRTILPLTRRDLRLDLFRGLANWAIFLDHIPNNAVAWLTTRNYGFSDAADLFVFISGYTASFVYARSMLTEGFAVGTIRLLTRAWQIYVAHVLLFVIYMAVIGYVAQSYEHSHLLDEFNVAQLIRNPIATLTHGLALEYKPLNLDVLPLYIVLMAVFPPVLWTMICAPDLTISVSLVLYFASRHFGWNLPAYPSGVWYFNPFTWQLLFLLGSWLALGGAAKARKLITSRIALVVGVIYLAFALVLAMAGRFDEVARLLPDWLVAAFNPNDKTDLAPYRVVHFLVLAILAVRILPENWKRLGSRFVRPLIVCGQQSLAVFCVGIFLSVLGHILLEIEPDSLGFQILVSASGIGLMTGVAYYRSWATRYLEAKREALSPRVASADNRQKVSRISQG